MKQCYSKLSLFLAFFTLLFYLPHRSFAQCLCPGGKTPQTLVYTQVGTISPSTDSTVFTFSKFDPSLGTLICVGAKAYVTSIIRMKLENDEIFDVYNYRIRYTRTDQLTGPGISPPISGSLTKNYGAYFLAASDGTYFSGPDYMILGPDTVYKNKLFEGTTSNVSGYLGPGTVSYTYKVSGSTVVTGSSNYIFSISANDRIDFEMVYSYCTAGTLPMGIKDFSASKKDPQNVMVNWLTENETKNTRYDIEASQDGISFQSIGNTQSANNGNTTKYEYIYHLNQAVGGKMYFRLKQTQVTGNITYTAVRMVSMEQMPTDQLNIFPNPAINKISMQFDKAVKGDYLIEITNQVGQTIYSRNIKINNNNTVEIEIASPPAPGVYYVRAKERNTLNVYSGKVFIK